MAVPSIRKQLAGLLLLLLVAVTAAASAAVEAAGASCDGVRRLYM
jgi:hypothetical protein